MNRQFVAGITAILLFISAYSAELSEDEQAVWKLEKAYWAYAKNNDIQGYLSLWDERFVGWPRYSQAPSVKQGLADWIPRMHENPAILRDFVLTRKAIRSFGDVVVVHYLMDFYRSDEPGSALSNSPYRTNRMTHTWQRRRDTWQIISGMSGEHVQSAAQ